MPTNLRAYALAAISLASGANAQEEPLSVIDWVKRHPDQPAMTSATLPKLFEPPVAPSALTPTVTVQPLDAPARQIIGLVPSSVTGLPESLWSGSTATGVDAQLDAMPTLRLPAAQALYYTVLLTEAAGPRGDAASDEVVTLARVKALTRLGATDPALALLEQAGVTASAPLFAAYMDLTLLTGQEDRACAILAGNLHLAPSMGHRIFCTARLGDWPTAALLYDTAVTLDDLPKDQSRVLERFLYPEAFEDAAPLPRPDTISPLLFRLHEAIGEPLPTRALPRSYSVTELRDLAGWKTQLEAAERLAETGALPANRLLGLYTSRQPAASGGVWDRVQAVQRFETALRARSEDAIAKTLPPAWTAMSQAGLEIPFADLFAGALTRYDLDGTAGQIAQDMALLSASYRQTSAQYDLPPLYAAIATGEVENISTSQALQSAVLRGFDTSNARRDLVEMTRNDRMGEAILRTLRLLDEGYEGDLNALTQGLATLRTFGLEDTARRAALQILLLDRSI